MADEISTDGSKKDRVEASILRHLDKNQPCGFDFKAVCAELPDINSSYVSKIGKKLRANKFQPSDGAKPEGSGSKTQVGAGSPTKHEAQLTSVAGFNTMYAFQVGQVKEVLNPNDLVIAYQEYLRLKTKYGFRWSYSDLIRCGVRYFSALYRLTEEGINGQPDTTGESGGRDGSEAGERDPVTNSARG